MRTQKNAIWINGEIYKLSLKYIRYQNFFVLLLSRFSCVWLCATPQTSTHQAPPSLGFSRQEHWSGLPLPSPMQESEKWKWSRCHVRLFATSWTAAYQAPLSMGFSRQEYWSLCARFAYIRYSCMHVCKFYTFIYKYECWSLSYVCMHYIYMSICVCIYMHTIHLYTLNIFNVHDMKHKLCFILCICYLTSYHLSVNKFRVSV